MSSETDQPRQRTVAELLAENGGGGAGRRRRRREADDPVETPDGEGSDGRRAAPTGAAAMGPQVPTARPWLSEEPPSAGRRAAPEPAGGGGGFRSAGPDRNGAGRNGYGSNGHDSGRAPVDGGPANGWDAGTPEAASNGRTAYAPNGSAPNGFGTNGSGTNGSGANGAPAYTGRRRAPEPAAEAPERAAPDRPAPERPAPERPAPAPAPDRPAPDRRAQDPWAHNPRISDRQTQQPSPERVGRPQPPARPGQAQSLQSPAQAPGRGMPPRAAFPSPVPVTNGRPAARATAPERPTEQIPRYTDRAGDAVAEPSTGPIDAPRRGERGAADRALADDGGPPTQLGGPPLDDDVPGRPADDGGPATQAAAFDPDDLDDELDDAEYPADRRVRPDEAPAGLGSRRRAAELEEDDDLDEEAGTGQAWAVVIGQWIAGALAGAAIWVGFRYLWFNLPVVALAAAVILTVGLVIGVRALLRNDDLRTTVFAVLVGLLLTVSPAILVLLDR
jgi:hypothetical protein